MFNATKGLQWADCSSQEAYEDPCEACERVTCEIDHDHLTLTSLSMNEMDMVGSIPAEIGHFSHLEYLDLGLNQLGGTIPHQFYQLHNLVYLDLSYNEISGTISPLIAEITHLCILYAESGQLSGSIPPEIAQLDELEIFYITSNYLNGTIPPELSQLQNLHTLAVYSNELTGTIPPELSKLTELLEFDLYQNHFYGSIPTEMSQMESLELLYLSENHLTGTIPPEFSQLVNLQIFDIFANKINGTIPPEICQLENLQIVYFDYNELVGTIPREIYQWKSMQRLMISYNKISGSIPKEISQLAHLEGILFTGNELNGSIPIELFDLVSLEELELSWNRLVGTISPEFGKLSNLTKLSLSSNGFSGTIPTSLGSLNKLKILDISNNQLSGSFPFEWIDKSDVWNGLNVKNSRASPFFRSLTQLKACCNHFSGILRDFINPFLTTNNLVQLDLSYNEISGSFDYWPEKWFEYYITSGEWYDGFVSLIILDLSSNGIEGQLPMDLPITLSIFFVGRNQLMGPIPNSYSQFFIFLSNDNNLRGDELPEYFESVEEWDVLHDFDGSGVECKRLKTMDGSAKVFDIQPVYDHFARCKCRSGYFDFQSDSSHSKPFARCKQAPLGYFTPTRNRLTQAIPCPIGHFSNRHASTQCDICTSNTFSFEAQSKCVPCPTKAQCADGVIGLKENTWIHPMRKLNESTKNEDIHDCLNNEACIVNGSSVTCAWQVGYDNSSILCSECLGGIFFFR